MKRLNNKGFSLVEILVAIALLAVLMMIASQAYNSYKKKARQQAYDTMAKSATVAATNYLMENNKAKYISFETLKDMQYVDTLQDPRYKENECTGIVINKVIPGESLKQLDELFQKVKLCCKNYKYQYDYTGDEVTVTEIDSCEYVEGDEIDGVYKLIYKPQGGTPCDPGVVIKQQREEWGPLCETTKENYIFRGWNTKKNGSGSTITEHTLVGDRDINAYAIWTALYTLTFNEDGGTACNPKTIERESGEKWGTLCASSKTGYAFKGWTTKKDGQGTKITQNTYAEKNVTAYAHWNPYYTLTFNSNGGSACNPATITEEKGEPWGTMCTPTRSGYVFDGWNTAQDGTGTTVTATTEVTGNITVFAKWNPNYTITYNTNGGSACNPATLVQEKGKKWGTLCSTTKTGYNFQAWKDQDGNVVTKDTVCAKNLTLTAQWTAKPHTLTYNNNGGSGCTTKQGTYDQAWGTLCTPTPPAGKVFSGWKHNSTTVTNATICKGDITVTAQYGDASYTLRYNDNGGSGCSSQTITKTYNTAWGTLCTPTAPTGKKFGGWYNGSTKVTSSSKATADITVTAKWDTATYTLTYNDNGGSGCSSQSITKDYNVAWGTLCTPTAPTGKNFTGWKYGSTTINSSSKATADITVTAQYGDSSYTLTYNDNGGSGCSSKSITKTYNTAWGTLCTPTAPTGKKFSAWKYGSTTITSASKATASITVTAQYADATFTLTYNSNGGSTCSPTSITKTYNTAWGTLCSPTRTGYSFSGWKNGSTTITSSSKATANITVTAQWTALTPKTFTGTAKLKDYYGTTVSGYNQSLSCSTYDSSCTASTSTTYVSTRSGSIVKIKAKSFTLNTTGSSFNHDWVFSDSYYITDSTTGVTGLNARSGPSTSYGIVQGLDVGHSFIASRIAYDSSSSCPNHVWAYGYSEEEGWYGWVCSYYLY